MKKYFLFISSLFLLNTLIAQDFSNKGKDFWVAYGYHVRMVSNTQDMLLYFATDQVTNITITIPGTGYRQTLTSGPTPTILTSDPIPKIGTGDVRLLNESTSPENKGIHITSDKPMVAYAHIYNSNVSGATILFPTNILGKEYYSINYTNNSNEDNSNGWFYVIATDTGNTTVEITPSAATINHPAGIPFTINLTQGQVYNIMGQLTGGGGGGGGGNFFTGVDLTGSKIKSIASANGTCKKIAVFSGSGKINITCSSTAQSSSDNYMVQSFPKEAWGKKFLTEPTSSLNFNIYRVCVLNPSTIVKLNGSPIPYPLVNNFYYEIPATTSPLKIEADQPVTVAQYIATQGACGNPPCNGGGGTCNNPGDPEVIYLSPVEQNISKVIWNATPNFNILQHYYNVVIPKAGTAISSFKLDGINVNPSLFITHPQDPNYAYLSSRLSNSGVHIIESDSGFNAIAYGFGSTESYGYNAGTNIKDLFNFLQPLNPLSLVSNPVACTGTPFYYSVTFPFQPTSLYWDFHNNPLQSPNTNILVNNPVADTTYFIGNKQVWRYKLNTSYIISVPNNSPGYLVTVTAGTTSSEGCGNSFDRDFYLGVYDPPNAHLYYQNNGCINDTVRCFDSTIYQTGTYSYKWFWDFGDGHRDSVRNPKHRYQNPGTYTIKFSMISNVGCYSDTAYKDITISGVPIANYFSTTPACVGSTIIFKPLISLNLPGNIQNWYWTFGDGNSQNISLPDSGVTNHIYSNPGIYHPTLWVKTNTGCPSKIDTGTIQVGHFPEAGFINPEVCLSDAQALFIDTSHVITGNVSGWIWDFGDTTSGILNNSTQQNPTHSYHSIGVKNVQLIAITNVGCRDTVMQSFYVNGSTPHAGIELINSNTICANSIVSIKDTSTVEPGSIVKTEIYWDYLNNPTVFETDDLPFFGKIYTHNYPIFQTPASKNFRVRFRAYSGTICIDDAFLDIIVHALPKVIFNPIPDTCLYINPFPITEAIEISGLQGSFYFSGPGISNNGIFNPSTVGVSTDTLQCIYISTAGCSDTAYQQIQIIAPPLANFGFNQPVCIGSDVIFTDSSSIPNGNIGSWTWDFGDGTPFVTQTNNNPINHIYNISGAYPVKLTVTSVTGCNSLVKEKNVYISPQPVPGFTHSDTACLPNALVQFNSISTISDASQNTLTYLWNFNDPSSGVLNIGSTANPTHVYQTFGNYLVQLTVTSNAGCVHDTTISVNNFHLRPDADFRFDRQSVCLGDLVRMIDLSIPVEGNIISWHWNYDNGIYSNLVSPNYTYSDSGLYNVSLYVINNYGCNSDTATHPFYVYAYPLISAGPDMNILEDVGALLQSTATGTNLTYTWTSGLYLNNTHILNPYCTPSNDINYLLTVTGIGGCVSKDEVKIFALRKLLIPNTFSPNKDGINDYWEISNLNLYPDANVRIFTRTGQKVFESNGYRKPWDGTKSGNILPIDTYYYIIEPGSGRPPVKGYVTIIK